MWALQVKRRAVFSQRLGYLVGRFLLGGNVPTPSTSSTFTFGPDASTKLNDLSRNTGLSKEELLRRALTLYGTAFKIARDGGQIILKKSDGTEVEVDQLAATP